VRGDAEKAPETLSTNERLQVSAAVPDDQLSTSLSCGLVFGLLIAVLFVDQR
jgi:hypothetical protein